MESCCWLVLSDDQYRLSTTIAFKRHKIQIEDMRTWISTSATIPHHIMPIYVQVKTIAESIPNICEILGICYVNASFTLCPFLWSKSRIDESINTRVTAYYQQRYVNILRINT